MPLFSKKQIDAAHDLITGQWMDINQLADAMDCNIRDAWHLIKLVKQKYPGCLKGCKPKVNERPPAVYSNKNYSI